MYIDGIEYQPIRCWFTIQASNLTVLGVNVVIRYYSFEHLESDIDSSHLGSKSLLQQYVSISSLLSIDLQ